MNPPFQAAVYFRDHILDIKTSILFFSRHRRFIAMQMLAPGRQLRT